MIKKEVIDMEVGQEEEDLVEDDVSLYDKLFSINQVVYFINTSNIQQPIGKKEGKSRGR